LKGSVNIFIKSQAMGMLLFIQTTKFPFTSHGTIVRRRAVNSESIVIHFILLLLVSLTFSNCTTIANYDADTFTRTAQLKANTLVLMSHADEQYSDHVEKVDGVLILAEELYSIQKARDKNHVSIAQWKILMEDNLATNTGVLTGFFDLWEEKGKVSSIFVDEAKPQIAAAFDEILKLEGSKLKGKK